MLGNKPLVHLTSDSLPPTPDDPPGTPPPDDGDDNGKA